MVCPKCGRDLVIIDYPEMFYFHNEDTEWGVWPDLDTGDPGMLVAKSGAKPFVLGCDKEKIS